MDKQRRPSYILIVLHQDYLACSSDLQEVLQLDPNVQEAEKELEEVTVLLRESLAKTSPAKPRKSVPITEVGVLSPLSSRREKMVPKLVS